MVSATNQTMSMQRRAKLIARESYDNECIFRIEILMISSLLVIIQSIKMKIHF